MVRFSGTLPAQLVGAGTIDRNMNETVKEVHGKCMKYITTKIWDFRAPTGRGEQELERRSGRVLSVRQDGRGESDSWNVELP